jgi:hypothetical protein
VRAAQRLRLLWQRGRYGTLSEPQAAAQPADLSVTGSRVAAAGSAAFRDMTTSLVKVEQATALPFKEDKATVLCYLCSVRSRERKPMTDEQYEAFVSYVHKRYTTYIWLGMHRAIPSFFFPVLFPLITTALIFSYDGFTDTVNTIVSAVFAVIGVIGGQLSGWVITGTQPNASSEAANHCQNMLMDLSDDYVAIAYYLLDLYCNESPKLRAFACEVAAAINTELLEEIMLGLIPRPDPNEPEDPILSRARFHRILEPLAEVVAYIQSQGCVPPVDEVLRGRIEVASLREQMDSMAQKLEVLSALLAAHTQPSHHHPPPQSGAPGGGTPAQPEGRPNGRNSSFTAPTGALINVD